MINEALINNSVEFFAVNEELFFTQNGYTDNFEVAPSGIINLLAVELDQDTKANNTISKYFRKMKRLEIFGICRFGDFNKVADFSLNSNNDDAEYYQCGKRGQCKYEGIRCKQIVAPNGVLTKREIEVIRLIAQDKSDKEIAIDLDRSPNTIAVHRQHILLKLGAHSKAGIAAFAAQRNLM